jgi:hypothetical protein
VQSQDALTGAHIDSGAQIKRARDDAAAALKAANDSSAAALQKAAEANGISTDTAKRQLRAYIAVEPGGPIEDFAENIVPHTRVDIRDTGQTPAYDLRVRGTMIVGDYPLIPNVGFPLDADPDMPQPSVAVVSPGGQWHGQNLKARRPFAPDEINSVAYGRQMRVYVYGTVTYNDAFKVPHYANYCFSFWGRGPQLTDDAWCSQHTDAN